MYVCAVQVHKYKMQSMPQNSIELGYLLNKIAFVAVKIHWKILSFGISLDKKYSCRYKQHLEFALI